jgi:hypothetical protein
MEGRYSDLLYIAPKTAEMRELNGSNLEEINGDKFILSYEVLSNARVGALNAYYECVLVKTNYTYNYLFDNPIASGGFFAKDAQEQGRAVAVLGLSAANAIFGGSDIYGKTITVNNIKYTIVGVMDDGVDDEKRVYTPINNNQDDPSSTPGSAVNPGGRPQNPGSSQTSGPVFIMASTGSLTADQIKNELKSVNISERNYYFAPIGLLAGLVGRMPINILMLIGIVLLIIIVIGFFRIFIKNLSILRNKVKESYFFVMLWQNRGAAIKFLSSIIVILGSLAFIVYTINNILPDVLVWMDMRELMGFHFYSDCAGVIEQVRSAALLTLIGLGAVIIAGLSLVLAFIAVLTSKSEKPPIHSE